MRDEVYRKPQSHIVDFAFSDEVAAVFPDMIRRSVPGYDTVIPVTGLLAARHLGAAGVAFDLGCSLGATTQAILAQNDADAVTVVGIDNSAPMIERARTANQDSRASFRLGDVEADSASQLGLEGVDVIVLNFVLQFLNPHARPATLEKLFGALNPGGLLIVSEKVSNDDGVVQALFDTTHLAWKRANGYSELEVAQKRSALENVMRIDTEAVHVERLLAAGFHRVVPWYRCLNWASFAAYREA